MAEETYGYVIIDGNTGVMDWDGLVHDTRDAAVRSLTERGSGFCRTEAEAEADDDLMPWWTVYNIHPVGQRIEAVR